MIANTVLSIVSWIIGGGLVLAGQFFVKRAEDKRVWLIRLQEAASDLATSYLQEAATVNDRRRAGTDMSRVETATYVVDRQKALGRFRTLPWSSDFEAQRQAMGRTIEGVWQRETRLLSAPRGWAAGSFLTWRFVLAGCGMFALAGVVGADPIAALRQPRARPAALPMPHRSSRA